MKFKPSPATVGAKLVQKTVTGQQSSTWEARQGMAADAETITGNNRQKVLNGEGEAYVGASMGVTIPGPPKSYLSGRIDAHCYLPSNTDDASIQSTLKRAKQIVQASIEEDSEELNRFFEEWVKQ